jgi:hypothetical protein
MKSEGSEQFVDIKILDCIQVNPAAIANIFVSPLDGRLYVSR